MLTASPVAKVDSASSTTTSPASTPIRASSPSSCTSPGPRTPRARARRVVLVRARHAERRHHRVAGELLDRAAVLLDALRRRVEELVHPAPHDLRIDAPTSAVESTRSTKSTVASLRSTPEYYEEPGWPPGAGRARRPRTDSRSARAVSTFSWIDGCVLRRLAKRRDR